MHLVHIGLNTLIRVLRINVKLNTKEREERVEDIYHQDTENSTFVQGESNIQVHMGYKGHYIVNAFLQGIEHI